MPTRFTLWTILITLTLVLINIAPSPTGVTAQGNGSDPDDAINVPYIVTFELTPDRALTVSEVEAADISATLNWLVRNLSAGDVLQVETYTLNGWVPVPGVTGALQASDAVTTIIRPTDTFAPPAYRLSIVGEDGNLRDQRVVTLRYTDSPRPPRIDTFSADRSTLDEDALAAGNGSIRVEWDVSNRAPNSNLIFAQLSADGTAISAEEPRAFAWVPSTGSGRMQLQAVAPGEPLQLWLRVVNLADGTLLSERLLSLPLGEAAQNTPVINSFTATPQTVERNGEIVVTWSVSGTDTVTVWLVPPGGQIVRDDVERPANGSLTLQALSNSFYEQEILLSATDATNTPVTQRVRVEVACPFEFFMDFAIDPAACPLTAPREFPGAYQLFDRGEMLWRSDRNTIIVLFNDGTYLRFEDTWQEGEEIGYPDSVLALELGDENQLPIRGFGKVWANNPQVREGLGFAIGDELGYGMTGQEVAAGRLDRDFSDGYITLPDSSVVELSEDNTWRKPGE
jgi:hypothetical protein